MAKHLTKYIIMSYDEPLAVVDTRADAEEFILQEVNDNLFYEFNWELNMSGDLDYVKRLKRPSFRLASAGYEIIKVTYLY